MWRRRSPSPRQLRFAWLTELARAIHADARGTYGWRRAGAKLVDGHGVIVNRKTIRKIMRLHGLPGPRKGFRSKANIATAADLVERRFDRPAPDQLGVTEITEHPTREGKGYCCVVPEVFSRRAMAPSINTPQATPLVTNALGMAIHHRTPQPGTTVIHSDHGSQFTSWASTQRAGASELLPWMGTIGDADDNAVIESFWARMQTELLDRRRWKTRWCWPTRSLGTWRSSTTGSDATARWVGALPLNSRNSMQPTSPNSHTPRSPNGNHINLV